MKRLLRLRASSSWRNDTGSAVVGWVLVAPTVLSVVLVGVDVARGAYAAIRVHAAAVRVAYVAASASDETQRTRAVTLIANKACANAKVSWKIEPVAAVPMVAAQVQCDMSSTLGVTRDFVSTAHAPLERP